MYNLPIRVADRLRSDLILPIVVAPMFLVSGPELLIASCRAGLMGSLPTQNARTADQLRTWFKQIRTALSDFEVIGLRSKWAVSMPANLNPDRYLQELELLKEFRPDVVMTPLVALELVLEAVHTYGGAVFADVTSLEDARQAVEAGVDGLMLVCHGAGGHTGENSAFAFVSEVRRFFKGVIVVGGAISDGRGILAAEVLGADLVCMGTRFIACHESMASDEYRGMMIRARINDVVSTKAVTGQPCSCLAESLLAAGFDEAQMASGKKFYFPGSPSDPKPWKNIYGAGQGVGQVECAAPLATVVSQLQTEYRKACTAVTSRSPIFTSTRERARA